MTASPLRSPRLRLLALGLVTLAMVGSSGRVPGACGPFLPVALFAFDKHPDFPLKTFARGQLGVLQPTYARSYLIVAYRQMSGLPVTDAEAEALVALWQTRLSGEEGAAPDEPGMAGAAAAAATASANAATDEAASANAVSGVTLWRDARRELTGKTEPAVYNTERAVPGVEYQWYPNVHEDAFRQAAETLRARAKTFGKDSPLVSAWVTAQELVFTIDKGVPAALTPLSADAPALARADRAYQIASAHFYAGEFATARAAFQAIGGDSGSPWRTLAPYLAARCLLRQGTVDRVTPAEAERLLDQAAQEFAAIAADASAPASLRESSEGLDEYARLWHDIVQTTQKNLTAVRASAGPLLAATPGAAIAPALDRFTRLLDRLSAPADAAAGAASIAPPSTSAAASTSASAAASPDDLVDWIDIFQSARSDDGDRPRALASRSQAGDAALVRWRRTKTLPWLVAALTGAAVTTSDVDALLAAASSVPSGSPAYATVAFHRARLLIDRRDLPSARIVLDTALGEAERSGVPLSALNRLRALRLLTARTLDEFLTDAATPSLATSDNADSIGRDDVSLFANTDASSWLDISEIRDRKTGQRLFDMPAGALVNRLPLAELVKAAESAALPAPLRRDVANAAWTRAILLEDSEAGARVAPLVSQLLPALKTDVDAYVAGKTTDERRIAGAWAILRHPGLSPIVRDGLGRLNGVARRDSLHDNWWCGPPIDMNTYTPSVYSQAPRWPGGAPPAFLSPDAQAAAARELERLRPASATWLSQTAVAWAKAQPADPRLPEALHLAVESGRWGCTDPATAQAARAAFMLLHARFASSPWAAKTKYWYK
jgi:hypothetical protein